MKKEPDFIDFYKVFKDYGDRYSLVGRGLNVNTTDITYNPRKPEEALSIVFQRWKNKDKEVTWDKLIEVCETFSNELGKVLSDIRRFLASQKAYDRYFEKPDRK